MAMKITERGFQTEVPVFVKRSFIAGGRKFERGHEFPWREMKVAPEKVATMFRTGKVHHKGLTVGDKPRPTEPAVPVAETVEPEREADDLDAIDDMKALRAIADEVGAPYKVSKADQREAIREARSV